MEPSIFLDSTLGQEWKMKDLKKKKKALKIPQIIQTAIM